LSGVPVDLVCELLKQSLAAWRVVGNVRHDGDGVVVACESHETIRIERAPAGSMFRWMITGGQRKRGAVSLIGVLRQSRELLDPAHATGRVRIAVTPLVPS
jgi:hypothetical protein